MPNVSGKIYIILSVESIAIAALLIVSVWHHFADCEQSHVALVDDSVRKLRHQIDDAKLLSAGFSISHIPILRQGLTCSPIVEPKKTGLLTSLAG